MAGVEGIRIACRLIPETGQLHRMLENLKEQCDTVEECYEFMLAYAAQGLPGDSGSTSGSELRRLLARAAGALAGMPASYAGAIEKDRLQPADKHRAFLDVLSRDSKSALAALELVLGQSVISSQLIDNLNASIHLRALLTDLFLVDELTKLPQSATK